MSRARSSLGFDRAFITIIDTHVTTILSSVILYLYGSGPIRGFAVTLILGLLDQPVLGGVRLADDLYVAA